MDASLVYSVLAALSAAAVALNRLVAASSAGGDAQQAEMTDKRREERRLLRSLQQKYFPAYFLAVLGDWLQGPYVYQLYAHYGFSEGRIAILFLAGFASSSIFGTFTGPLADKYGRRKMALLFCVLYSTCCLIKLVPNFWILLLGRLLGGVSTSLLFSVFESWYVSSHRERLCLPSELASETFSLATTANGLLAISAGVAANLAAESYALGPTAPFLLAVPCFAACLAVVLASWEENHGDQDSHLLQAYSEGLLMILRDRRIFCLGLAQSVVESCMYTFVFLWTPVLSNGSTPLGLIFSSFMVAIMIGSSLFSFLLKRYQKTPQDTLFYATVTCGLSTLLCSFFAGPGSNLPLLPNQVICYAAFLVLELGLGLYFPSAGCLRGEALPESHRATIANWFRVPMNLLTCASLVAVNHPAAAADKRIHFAACTAALAVGAAAAAALKKACRVDADKKD